MFPADSCRRALVVGQGYVGLPLAMLAVQAGHHVIGYDVDAARVKALANGTSFIEDVPSAVLVEALCSGRYEAHNDVSACSAFDVAVITVPTPLRDGMPDVSHIEMAAITLAPMLRAGVTVVLESTTYPGTTEELVAPLLEAGSGLVAGVDFDLGYSPERIDPGNREWTIATTPKVVSGVSAASLDAVRGFYDTMVVRTVPVSGTREAELPSCWRTRSGTSTSPWSTNLRCSPGSSTSTYGRPSRPQRRTFGFLPFKPGPGVGGH